MNVLKGLTAAKIGQLPASQIMSLTASDIADLTAAQLPGLTASQLGLFSAAQLAGFNKTQVQYLSISAIGGLTQAQTALLTTAQVSGFTAAQIATLSVGQIGALSAADIRALNATQIAALTKAQLAVLSADQLSGLSVVDIAALSSAQITSLSANSIAALNDKQVKALTAAQLAGLTATQFSVLTGTQIGALTIVDIRALSTTQVASMTAAQIAGLSAGQIGALTSAQLASLNINYNSMLGILQADAAGGMTADKFNALQALVGTLNAPGGIPVSSYVQQITDNVVMGNAANATWTGGASSSVALGNLTASSSETQVDELLGKWFLGTDLPSSNVTMSAVPNLTVSYSDVSDPLFGSGGPSMSDVNQGYLGDCFVLAPLAEMASQDPSAIQSMITANGNNTYSVRFTVDGTNDYVTVDDKLADGGDIFNRSSNDWASLIEKAYTQLQTGGAVTGDNFTYGNSFSSIASGGYAEATLEELTGASTLTDFDANGSTWSSYTYNGASLAVPNNPNSVTLQSSATGLSEWSAQAALIADLTAGDDLILSSSTGAEDKNGQVTLVAGHAMAVYGFDASTGMFEIYNPWGTQSGGAQYWDTTFETSLPTLLADKDAISVATNASPLSNSAATLFPGPTQQLTSSLGLAAAVT